MTTSDKRQAALGFLNALREDPAVRKRVADRRDELTPEDLVALGASLGRHFDARDVSQAFRRDWLLRWMHFRAKKGSMT
jgi:hypothetical protein